MLVPIYQGSQHNGCVLLCICSELGALAQFQIQWRVVFFAISIIEIIATCDRHQNFIRKESLLISNIYSKLADIRTLGQEM